MTNNNAYINYEALLKRTLQILHLTEEQVQNLLEKYQVMVIKRLATLLIDQASDQSPAARGEEDSSQEVIDLFESINKGSSLDEKGEMLQASRFSVFIEIIAAILETCSAEENTAIAKILASDAGFRKIYQEWAANQKTDS